MYFTGSTPSIYPSPVHAIPEGKSVPVKNNDNDMPHDPKALFLNPVQGSDLGRPSFQKRVVVDSRDRNRSLFPEPNRYQVSLDNEIRNIVRVDLSGADIPLTARLVSKKNREVPFAIRRTSTAGDEWTRRVARLREGDYSSALEMGEELERALNEESEDIEQDAFRVTFNSRLDAFRVFCKRRFRLLWSAGSSQGGTSPDLDKKRSQTYAQNSAGRLLGFDTRNEESEDATTAQSLDVDDPPTPDHLNVIAGVFRKNFISNRYVIMRLSPLEQALQSSNENSDSSFAVLVDKKADGQGFAFLGDRVPHHTYRPMLPRLRRLEFSFVDYEGEPYDFQNHDHRLELVFHVASSDVNMN